MPTIRVHSILLLGLITGSAMPASAAENLHEVAEHLLEQVMDARYLSLPDFHYEEGAAQPLLQIGYLDLDGGSLQSNVLMLGVERYYPWSLARQDGILVSAFVDLLSIEGEHATAPFDPFFVQEPPFSVPATVLITGVDGRALHSGISVAYSWRMDDNWGWQLGAVLEYYHIEDFVVAFQTQGQLPAFVGQVDYSGNYRTATPYIKLTWYVPAPTQDLVFAAHAIKLQPQSRSGFHGRLSGADYYAAGDGESTGHGLAFPDEFTGLGYSITSRSSGWQLDIGASVFFAYQEPKKHEGVTPKLFLTFKMPLP